MGIEVATKISCWGERTGTLADNASDVSLAATANTRSARAIDAAEKLKVTSRGREPSTDTVCEPAEVRASPPEASTERVTSSLNVGSAAVTVTPQEKWSPTRLMRGTEGTRDNGLRETCSASSEVPKRAPEVPEAAYARTTNVPTLSGRVHVTRAVPDGGTVRAGRISGAVSNADRMGMGASI